MQLYERTKDEVTEEAQKKSNVIAVTCEPHIL